MGGHDRFIIWFWSFWDLFLFLMIFYGQIMPVCCTVPVRLRTVNGKRL